MKKHFHSLIAYLDELQKHGKFLFLKKEAAEALGVSEDAVRKSLSRLSQKGKVGHLKNGLYQIITLEYESAGSLPPEWIIDDLMN